MNRSANEGLEDYSRAKFPFASKPLNTIAAQDQPPYPGDLAIEQRINNLISWNTIALVVGSNQKFSGLGGHISTYLSTQDLLEVGFHHIFRGPEYQGGKDQVYFQGHASPGIYARAFLEGRLGTEQLEHFRRETHRVAGLSSYPHPRLMPDFWEFPTVSMGLGPLMAIQQARFFKYMQDRGLGEFPSRIFCFVGDGECDEPESLSQIALATRHKLDHCHFIINVNLQRLDGPVRSNGHIVDELESRFRGAGWDVIKLLWNHGFDDKPMATIGQAWQQLVDGELQKFTRDHTAIFDDLWGERGPQPELDRGGHDKAKIYAAYQAAIASDRPSVILALTTKGHGLGRFGAALNTTHQLKKLPPEALIELKNQLGINLTDEQAATASLFHPGSEDPAIQYMHKQRSKLGGFLPQRSRPAAQRGLQLITQKPELKIQAKAQPGDSTTKALSRHLRKLLDNAQSAKHVALIIPDEARTFGLDPLFKRFGIYAPEGQKYQPHDADSLLAYGERQDGPILQEGINEAGAMGSFIAAGTSYATTGYPMIPFYIFYSMFGTQRVGDLIWAAQDARCRGFLCGATAGKTTLNGEGLQHQDGMSPLIASLSPAIQTFDPAIPTELTEILKFGMQRMVDDENDELFYLTLYNEGLDASPDRAVGRQDIEHGLYEFRSSPKPGAPDLCLLGSGIMLGSCLQAQSWLWQHEGLSASVWSVPSFQRARVSKRLAHLNEMNVLTVAVSDYVKHLPELLREPLTVPFLTLGTDGFGRSDTRAALRRYFGVDAPSISLAVLDELSKQAGGARYERRAEQLRQWMATHSEQ